MEASALYTLAAKHGRRALAICTVSDHIVTGEETTAAEREQTFGEMVEIALAAALGGDLRSQPRRTPAPSVGAACGGPGSTTVAGAHEVELRTHPLERARR